MNDSSKDEIRIALLEQAIGTINSRITELNDTLREFLEEFRRDAVKTETVRELRNRVNVLENRMYQAVIGFLISILSSAISFVFTWISK